MKPANIFESFKSQTELLERYGGIALEKQLNFGALIDNGNNWSVDMRKEEISFGSNLNFQMQVLGTISHSSKSWLWAWANTKSGLTEQIIQQATALKSYGEKNNLDFLKNSSFSFSKEEMHSIGLIASGMFDSLAYYIADYGQGAMLVILKQKTEKVFPNSSNQQILTVFPQFIAQFEIDHKKALFYYLTAKGYTITQTDNKIIGAKENENIMAEFDSKSRLISLTNQ